MYYVRVKDLLDCLRQDHRGPLDGLSKIHMIGNRLRPLIPRINTLKKIVLLLKTHTISCKNFNSKSLPSNCFMAGFNIRSLFPLHSTVQHHRRWTVSGDRLSSSNHYRPASRITNYGIISVSVSLQRISLPANRRCGDGSSTRTFVC